MSSVYRHQRKKGRELNTAAPQVEVSKLVIHARGPYRKFELAIYSGREHLGTIKIQGQHYQAFGVDGKLLGEFPDRRAAALAIVFNMHNASGGKRAA
jgi:hypothetical protein